MECRIDTPEHAGDLNFSGLPCGREFQMQYPENVPEWTVCQPLWMLVQKAQGVAHTLAHSREYSWLSLENKLCYILVIAFFVQVTGSQLISYRIQNSLTQLKPAQNSSKQLKTVQTSSKQLKTVQNSSKQLKTTQHSSQLKTVHNSKQLKPAQNSSKQFKPAQNSSKQLKTTQNSSQLKTVHNSKQLKPAQNSSKQFKTVQNSSKQLKTAQNSSTQLNTAHNSPDKCTNLTFWELYTPTPPYFLPHENSNHTYRTNNIGQGYPVRGDQGLYGARVQRPAGLFRSSWFWPLRDKEEENLHIPPTLWNMCVPCIISSWAVFFPWDQVARFFILDQKIAWCWPWD